MSTPTVIDLLVASNGALWVVLFVHLFRCRDIRVDIEKIKIHTGMEKL